MVASQEDQPGTHKSQRQISKDLGVSRYSVRKMIKKKHLKAFKRIKVSRRDETVKQKRKTCCKRLNDRYSTKHAKDVERLVFTDEKDFTMEIARNRQNDIVYGVRKRDISASRLYRETSRFSKKVMVSAGVSYNGKTQIHFIDTSKTKVNSGSYMKLLDDGLIPDCRRLYTNNNYIFQQDGAPSHTSRITQDHLKDTVPELINKDDWPPQSPDCNPMDYHVWDSLSQKVYCGRNNKFTESELKERISQCWNDISLTEIRSSIESWKKRLWTVCSENGGPIDHLI